MKTIENNKLIAEFLGYIDNGCSEDGFLIHPITNYDVEISSLKYHEDWNWLMEVVKQIDKISLDAQIIWNLEVKANDIFDSLREVNIQLTYNRVIDFINFYNEQNKDS